MKLFFLLMIYSAACLSTTAADSPGRDDGDAQKRWRRLMEGPHVRRGILPQVKLQRPVAATGEEAVRIKRHIAGLADINRPDFGMSSTMEGLAFAAVPGSGSYSGGFILTDHQLETADDFRQLVAFGPRALPFLIEALEDKTPTKLKMDSGNSIFTVMELATELQTNPTNSLEQRAAASLPESKWDGTSLRDYTLKVGDVCFVIIGQIVGRAYLAVRYQPTAIVIINSPVAKKELAKAVRDIWSSTNAAQRLFDSLLFDYSTEGVFNGKSLDGWDIANNLQCQAALRMLYYFPRETSALIVERLGRLDVRDRGKGEFIQREITNGVRATQFIKAVAWSDERAVRRELLNIFKRTSDTEILLAALIGIDEGGRELARQRLNEMIDQLPADDPYGQGYNLLVALGEKLGSETKPTFIRYLKNPSLQKWRSMAKVLRNTRSDWAAELLSPALSDKREFGWTYAVVPGQNEPRRAIRVCDEAAETISLSRPDLPFRMEGEHEDLDRQIAIIRSRIEGVRP